jgi:hypothetical protein
MGCLLVCDCATANCYRTTPPLVVNGKPTAPPGWVMVTGKNGALLVACCEQHLDMIRKQKALK